MAICISYAYNLEGSIVYLLILKRIRKKNLKTRMEPTDLLIFLINCFEKYLLMCLKTC